MVCAVSALVLIEDPFNYAVCIVQCAVFSVQCAVCSVQCAVCIVQCYQNMNNPGDAIGKVLQAGQLTTQPNDVKTDD